MFMVIKTHFSEFLTGFLHIFPAKMAIKKHIFPKKGAAFVPDKKSKDYSC